MQIFKECFTLKYDLETSCWIKVTIMAFCQLLKVVMEANLVMPTYMCPQCKCRRNPIGNSMTREWYVSQHIAIRFEHLNKCSTCRKYACESKILYALCTGNFSCCSCILLYFETRKSLVLEMIASSLSLLIFCGWLAGLQWPSAYQVSLLVTFIQQELFVFNYF